MFVPLLQAMLLQEPMGLPAMPDLLIRSVPDDVHRAFAAGAVRLGITQAAYLQLLMRRHQTETKRPR